MQISKQIAANHAYGSSAQCEPYPGVSQHDRAWGGCYKQPSADAPGTGSLHGLQHKPAAEEAARVAPPRGWTGAYRAVHSEHLVYLKWVGRLIQGRERLPAIPDQKAIKWKDKEVAALFLSWTIYNIHVSLLCKSGKTNYLQIGLSVTVAAFYF